MSPITVCALIGKLLDRVTHQTGPLQLFLPGNHREFLLLKVFNSPSAPVVLGFPWLKLHNPHIDWSPGRIVKWSLKCHQACLQSARPPVHGALPPENPALPSLTNVPSVYHDLTLVFSKAHALSLPPHDCTLDLVAGCHLYNLSRAERDAMETYIKDFLIAGVIQPASFPLGVGYFFVKKNDSTLRPCIEFRRLSTKKV